MRDNRLQGNRGRIYGDGFILNPPLFCVRPPPPAIIVSMPDCPYTHSIGPFVRQRLRQLHLSQAEVGRRAGLDRQAVRRVCAGVQHPRTLTLAKIAAACGYDSLGAFLGDLTVADVLGPDVRDEIASKVPGE